MNGSNRIVWCKITDAGCAALGRECALNDLPPTEEEVETLIQDLLNSTQHCPARDVIAAGLMPTCAKRFRSFDHLVKRSLALG